MPSDLTGTPTSLGIGTYNTSVDAPSGLGFNEAMAQIDALIAERAKIVGSPAGGQVPVWNATSGEWEPGNMSLVIGGNVNVNFPGTALSDATVVSHGLGKSPSSIVFTHADDLGVLIDFFTTAADASTFTVKGRATGPIGPGAVQVHWMVV